MKTLSNEKANEILKECLLLAERVSHNNSDGKEAAKNSDDPSLLQMKTLCRLWAGAGYIYQLSYADDDNNDSSSFSVIVKHIQSFSSRHHQQCISDQRKAKSYHMEAQFYKHVATELLENTSIILPRPYLVEENQDTATTTTTTINNGDQEEIIIAMSYLQPTGKFTNLNEHAVMDWLATFHAYFWDKTSELVEQGIVHPIGSYWYLETRMIEYDNIEQRSWHKRLKQAARSIDQCMERDPMQSVIHGDAKDANIVTMTNTAIGMYDFQYCGKSPPTRDVAYFLTSSAEDAENEELIRYYYDKLCSLLKKDGSSYIPSWSHFKDSLDLAFCDYYRFMAGWGIWGNDISGRVQAFLDRLDNGKDLGSDEAYDKALRLELW